jgi:hypothetical protein
LAYVDVWLLLLPCGILDLNPLLEILIPLQLHRQQTARESAHELAPFHIFIPLAARKRSSSFIV